MSSPALILDKELTIFVVKDMKTKFDELLQKEGAIEIDASEISEIDFAGLQLLESWRISRHKIKPDDKIEIRSNSYLSELVHDSGFHELKNLLTES